MKTRTIIYFILILVFSIGSSFFATYYYHKNNEGGQEKKKTSMKDVMLFVYDELQLDKDQKEQFTQITNDFHRDGKTLVKKLKTCKIDLIKELAKDETDTLILNQLAEEIGKLETEIKKLTIDHYQKSTNILNTEQLKTLKKIYEEMIPISK